MPPTTAQRIEWARQVLRTTYAELMAFLVLKLFTVNNPTKTTEKVNDNDLNKRLAAKMEEVREDDSFFLLAVSGNHDRFLRGWMRLEEHRRHWELPYYELRTDDQWQEQLDDLEAIHDEIKGAKLM